MMHVGMHHPPFVGEQSISKQARNNRARTRSKDESSLARAQIEYKSPHTSAWQRYTSFTCETLADYKAVSMNLCMRTLKYRRNIRPLLSSDVKTRITDS